tara:strand:- start:1045 stop:1695 length:651 start_codon:yes stop_codon:yes gene_type:complete
MIKKVAVFGSSGLIGSHILKTLEKDSYFDKIIAPTRSPIAFRSRKTQNNIIDFKDYKSIIKVIKGCEIVFISIGTTQSKVKWNLNKYREIDYGIPIAIAKASKECHVNKILLVSSAGANINAKGFYLSLKGEIEKSLIDLNIKNTFIFRPSLLLGNRKENRFGEKIAQIIMPIFCFLLPKKYWPIHAQEVAFCMVSLSKTVINSTKTYHYQDIIND